MVDRKALPTVTTGEASVKLNTAQCPMVIAPYGLSYHRIEPAGFNELDFLIIGYRCHSFSLFACKLKFKLNFMVPCIF